ncbi:tol [Fusarium acutatum]|uniref:Tol n=1 Tax=Fusarium acutatum TaxID=78861 RepID=A0A8H4JCV0_9HYPO|nr:tol [Fusarium acutatum]
MPDRSPSHDSRDESSPEPERDRDRPRDRDRDRDRERDRDRDRQTDQERDRERDRERDHDRDLDRDLDIDGVVDRDLDRIKDRDRDREYDRDKDRERDRDRDRDRDRPLDDARDRDRDNGRDRDDDHGRDRDYANGKDRDRIKDREVDRDRRRESRVPPRVPREPRDRDHPPNSSKRNSITDRLLGSFRAVRGEKEKEIPIPAVASSIQRRASSAVTKGGPVLRIREWLDACNADHHHHCAVSSDIDITTWRPTWLIDVVERRLVKATPKDRYLALSYVNGTQRNGAPMFTHLLQSNVEAFQDRLPNLDMPQTYLDAMWLAKKLGIRHIWIDRICITQDNREEMDDHIKHMAYVFSNSYLTIVAATGDVYTGLPSLDPKRSTRGLRTTGRTHQELIAASPWYTRGWTLVERIYSRRSVFFFEDSITWECHCETWQGSPNSVMKKLRGGRQECTGAVPDAAFAFQHPPWPDLDEYARYAMEYSARKLTLVDDTLPAFAGITHVLSRSFPGGFIYGMPIAFLDIALLWRPHASIRRRALSRPPFLPSWSWMGWWFDNIPVDLTLWRAAADYVEEARIGKRGQETKRYRSAHPFRIKPTVTWSLTDRAATAPVMNTGLQYRDLRGRRSPSSELPPGWSRSGSYYVHDSDDSALFKYPIPVEDPPETGGYEPPVGEQAYPGPLLSFKTTTGFFEVEFHTTLAHRDRTNPPLAVGTIWNKANRWAGQFRAHDAWLGIQSSNYDGEERLEFIAISTATERRGSHVFDNEKFEEHMDADEMIDFVNVLWIERIGDIAYRRGVGQILLKTWEAQAKDEVGILLG